MISLGSLPVVTPCRSYAVTALPFSRRDWRFADGRCWTPGWTIPHDIQTLHQVIRRQSHHLIRLTDDLLDVSQFCRGKLTLHCETIDLREAIHDAVEMIGGEIDKKYHQLHQMMPSQPVWVQADRVRLAQLFANLLGNAAKYTPPSGRIIIDVDVDAEANQASIAVSDKGIGFSPEQAERIVAPFAQVDGSRTREYGGLGLGLTIVRRLVALHGGTFTTDSPGPGRGSTFAVSLPVVDQPATARKPPEPVPPNGLHTHDHLHAVTKRKPSVLIVEDNADASRLLKQLFLGERYETEVAGTGMHALQTLATRHFDVAILDIGLPGMDGYEVARRIRRLRSNEPMCMIALTGWGNPTDQDRARDAGFDRHLVKPVSFQELCGHIESLWNPRQPSGHAESCDEVVMR